MYIITTVYLSSRFAIRLPWICHVNRHNEQVPAKRKRFYGLGDSLRKFALGLTDKNLSSVPLRIP